MQKVNKTQGFVILPFPNIWAHLCTHTPANHSYIVINFISTSFLKKDFIGMRRKCCKDIVKNRKNKSKKFYKTTWMKWPISKWKAKPGKGSLYSQSQAPFRFTQIPTSLAKLKLYKHSPATTRRKSYFRMFPSMHSYFSTYKKNYSSI